MAIDKGTTHPEEQDQSGQWTEVQDQINLGEWLTIAELMRRKRAIESNPFVRFLRTTQERVAHEVTPEITQQVYRDASLE